MKFLLSLILTLTIVVRSQTPFSLDSASAYLRTLAVDIGPRPMGSPNERRAMEFALQKFKEFRLDEAYILPFKSIARGEPSATNTSSGTVVGVLRGASHRIIVIGAHIDSAGPDIPGANDDGSGSATVIELARVLVQRKNESTLVFALFGGEEQGLIGSRHLVQNFPLIDRAVLTPLMGLMLQVDMANGSDWLAPLIDIRTHSAPQWLVKAAYEEFFSLGYSGLSYPTHFFSLTNTLGAIRSDHMPFLEKNIPAIDFTSDVNDPIHTPEDSFENFTLAGLKRSGDLAYKLVERFDNGQPKEKFGNYFLTQIGLKPIFIPPWAIYLFIFISLLVTLAALALLLQRRSETITESSPKISGLKMFALALVIQTCVWYSENIVGIIKGVRFPWFSDPRGYFVLGFLGGCIGIWIALQIARTMKLSIDAYRYFLRAFIVLALFIALATLMSIKLAFYPATALFFLALAALIRRPILKLFFWILSPYFMVRLFFSEGFGLIARTLTSVSIDGIFSSIVFHAVYILLFALWSFPFLLGFVSIRLDAKKDFFWLQRFGTRNGIIAAGIAFISWTVFLATKPAYTQRWKQPIRIEQRLDGKTGKATITVKSIDYLNGLKIRMASRDTTISGWIRGAKLQDISVDKNDWIAVQRVFTAPSDSQGTFDLKLRLTMKYRPYTLSVSYTGGRHALTNIISSLAFSNSASTVTFRWYSFPDTSLFIPVQFEIADADSVTEKIEATFLEPIVPIQAEKDNGSMTYRTVLTRSEVIRGR